MKTRAIAALLLGAVASAAAPAQPQPSIEAVWIGGPTLLLEFGPIRLLTDPVLGSGEAAFRMIDPNSGTPDAAHARLTPLPDVDLSDLDVVLLSHDHPDHFDATAVEKLAGAPLVVPVAQAAALTERGLSASGLGWHASRTIAQDGYSVTITAVPAQHSTRPELVNVLGEVNGYWLEFARGAFRRTLYWTGDSFPVEAVKASAQRMGRPDILVPHLGAVGAKGPFGKVSMGADEALDLARAVKPAVVLPIHHSTFTLYREPVARFIDGARGESWRTLVPKEGSRTTLPVGGN